MARAKTDIVVLLVGLSALVAGIWFFRAAARIEPPAPPEPIVKRDTVWSTDTIIKPVPVQSAVVDSLRAAIAWKDLQLSLILPDTLRVTDTVYVKLPKEQRVYSDSTFYAIVSGYQPSLDYLRISQKTVYEENAYVIQKDYSRWALGVTGGYGVALQGGVIQIAPYIGVGVTYNILRLSKE